MCTVSSNQICWLNIFKTLEHSCCNCLKKPYIAQTKIFLEFIFSCIILSQLSTKIKSVEMFKKNEHF